MEETGVSSAQTGKRLDWRKRISDHVAYGLLVYTGLHIFVTLKAVHHGSYAILPYFALIVLVAAIIPACRFFEKRWEHLSDDEAVNPAYASAFRRDIAMIWIGAIGLPLLLTGLMVGLLALI